MNCALLTEEGIQLARATERMYLGEYIRHYIWAVTYMYPNPYIPSSLGQEIVKLVLNCSPHRIKDHKFTNSSGPTWLDGEVVLMDNGRLTCLAKARTPEDITIQESIDLEIDKENVRIAELATKTHGYVITYKESIIFFTSDLNKFLTNVSFLIRNIDKTDILLFSWKSAALNRVPFVYYHNNIVPSWYSTARILQ